MTKSMRRAFRLIELQQGEASERFFDEVLRVAKQRGKAPVWIKGWEHHKKWSAQDLAGVDFVIRTDRGNIKVNVKSSQVFAKKFRRNGNGKILAVVVNILEKPEEVYGKYITILGKRYKEMKRTGG